MLTICQFLLSIGLHHWLYPLPLGHRRHAERPAPARHRENPGLHRAGGLVLGGRREHHGRVGRSPESGRPGRVSIVRLLRWLGLFVFHQLSSYT